MKNYYEILEVNEKASLDTITKVFRMQVKKYHPDVVNEAQRKKAEDKIKELNEAYDVLSDEKKREEYDILIKNENSLNSDLYNENENLKKECMILKKKLSQKEQIIDHFLGGMDLSEFEVDDDSTTDEGIRFKDIQNDQNNNNDNNLKNESSIENSEKNEEYSKVLMQSLARIISVIVFLVVFFSITSIFMKINIFDLFFKAFFKR